MQRVPLGSIFRVKNADRRDRSSGKHKAQTKVKAPQGYHLLLRLKCKGTAHGALRLGATIAMWVIAASADFREVVFALDTREDKHAEFYSALLKRTFPSLVRELFAFTFRPPWEKVARWSLYDPHTEYQRQGIFNPCSQWRLTSANEKFSLCPTYPPMVVVPKSIDDDTLAKVAEFRSKGRLPVLSYKHVNHVGQLLHHHHLLDRLEWMI